MKILATAESPFRRALVPLDGSRIAETVLPVFLPMARPLQIEVALVRVVVPTFESSAVDESPEALEASQQAKEHKRQEALDYLRVVAAMPLFEGLSVTTSVRAGQAPDQIIDAARESEADLIAMTTHGRTGLRRLLFGSVAEAVLRTSHVPVFVVRATPVEAVTRVA
jgi:nucleotide-binding universal stress UspA family protein